MGGEPTPDDTKSVKLELVRALPSSHMSTGYGLRYFSNASKTFANICLELLEHGVQCHLREEAYG
jgi:hypothetical protein